MDAEFKQLLVSVVSLLTIFPLLNQTFKEELDLNPQKERELVDQSAEKKLLMLVEHQIRQVIAVVYITHMQLCACVICLEPADIV